MKKKVKILNTKIVEIGDKILLHPLSGLTVGMHKKNVSIGASDAAWLEIGNKIQINCSMGYVGVILSAEKINFCGYIENNFFSTEDKNVRDN